MLPNSAVDGTIAHGLDEGIGLALKAEDSGNWKAVADWIAHHPEHAEGLAQFLADQLQIPRKPAAVPDRVGSMVGGLELREEIDRGAMGVVYKAFDPFLKRDVAVKLLKNAEMLTEIERARFRFEAEVVAGLKHENIVEVHAFGEMAGVPYLVMPLLAGGSLAGWIKKLGTERCSPDKAAEFVRDIAYGIHHAHQRGLIHRDLKPANILLDEKQRPHVADFGLARRVDMTEASSGEMAGTVKYMALNKPRRKSI